MDIPSARTAGPDSPLAGTRRSGEEDGETRVSRQAAAAPPREAPGRGLIEPDSLPKRAFEALMRAGVFCLADLAARSECDVLKIPGIGRKGLADIEQYLSRKGITLPAERAERR